ncbi:hypothetical protein [Pelorhabdus rhamnosifermentans]|uniref:hypothetical protein n=1 Tax=Pelorhabdus rhamnosifermentans TaxID=2772457 RepID=UPI001C05F519|nr:hypothetical protein [Pelorhabdus rhamnosifermentans]
MAVSFIQIWWSIDMKEQIIISKGDFVLLDIASKSMTTLGKTLEESRKRLTELGKLNNFRDF